MKRKLHTLIRGFSENTIRYELVQQVNRLRNNLSSQYRAYFQCTTININISSNKLNTNSTQSADQQKSKPIISVADEILCIKLRIYWENCLSGIYYLRMFERLEITKYFESHVPDPSNSSENQEIDSPFLGKVKELKDLSSSWWIYVIHSNCLYYLVQLGYLLLVDEQIFHYSSSIHQITEEDILLNIQCLDNLLSSEGKLSELSSEISNIVFPLLDIYIRSASEIIQEYFLSTSQSNSPISKLSYMSLVPELAKLNKINLSQISKDIGLLLYIKSPASQQSNSADSSLLYRAFKPLPHLIRAFLQSKRNQYQLVLSTFDHPPNSTHDAPTYHRNLYKDLRKLIKSHPSLDPEFLSGTFPSLSLSSSFASYFFPSTSSFPSLSLSISSLLLFPLSYIPFAQLCF